MTVPATPSQTVGPFFHDCLLRDDARVLAGAGVAGQRIRIEGRVCDGAGAGVPDALVEVWQADANGRYRQPADGRDGSADDGFLGWGRAGTDEDGEYWFATVKPGPVPAAAAARGAMQAPHIVIQVFARGLLDHLTTRLYFADDPAAEADPVLALVEADRRATLLAVPGAACEPRPYRFDIRLQGEGETVFFDVGRRRGSR